MDKRNLSGVLAMNMGAWFQEVVKTFNSYLLEVESNLNEDKKNLNEKG